VPAAQVLRADLPGQAQERALRRLAPEHERRYEVLFIPLDRVVDPDLDTGLNESRSGYGSGISSESGSGSRVLMTKNVFIFFIKNCNLLIPRPP
jgi:hypothetical protein